MDDELAKKVALLLCKMSKEDVSVLQEYIDALRAISYQEGLDIGQESGHEQARFYEALGKD